MSDCPHIFIGKADGVHCTRCGLHMSAREYGEYCAAKEGAEKGDKDCAQFVSNVDAGEYTTEATMPRTTTDTILKEKASAEASQAKPERTRKKKEVTANG